MADFLQTRKYIRSDQAACVTINIAANVKLMTDSNFQKYKRGAAHDYYGGYYKKSPVFIRPPRSNNYNIVIDLGGGTGNIKHSISIVDA